MRYYLSSKMFLLAEKKTGWYLKNFTEIGLIVRNIVSDADKLEAIGEIGVNRCCQYTREKYGEDLSKEKLVSYVKEHCEEKLFLLSEKYIKTE